jgi:hypothetical protein
VLNRQQGIGKFTEELFEQASNAVHVMVEAFWVAKIDLGGICY